ncbi:putative membrane protein [Promicromonospora sp. AC04]|uniref:DoxX family protein n=1 Tax=Promicromonospora sp. AC04 TaxID=2135723 RepID=UPI000D41B954|nr:hypothetical protein [Promicromonospora sp. AC04]PUB25970.1 putative membrane protein [Promicromonospora sp. AC04]
MAPLVVLVLVTAVLLAAGAVGVRLLRPWVVPLRGGLAAMFVLTGTSHFGSMRDDFISMVPPALPEPGLLVTLSGLLELAGAVGLLLPPTVLWASGGLTALLLAMFPANIYAASQGLMVGSTEAMPLVPRTLIQVVYLSATVAVLAFQLRARRMARRTPGPAANMHSALEVAMPHFQFRNHHSRWIDAPPAAVWEALASLTLSDLTISRALVGLRYLGRAQAGDGPLFDTGPITMLRLDAPDYAIGGSIARPWQRVPQRQPIETLAALAAFDEPGWAKYLTDFSLTAERGGTRLRTEMRGYCTDDHAWKRFRIYWNAIRIGSGLVRRDILRSVARAARTGSGPVRPDGPRSVARKVQLEAGTDGTRP